MCDSSSHNTQRMLCTPGKALASSRYPTGRGRSERNKHILAATQSGAVR